MFEAGNSRLSECDSNAKAAARPCNAGPVDLTPLRSVRIIGRILYINNDPGMNYLLPLGQCWRVNDMADEIMRACFEYDVKANYESARFLAVRLAKEILKDKRQINGGFELGWD